MEALLKSVFQHSPSFREVKAGVHYYTGGAFEGMNVDTFFVIMFILVVRPYRPHVPVLAGASCRAERFLNSWRAFLDTRRASFSSASFIRSR